MSVVAKAIRSLSGWRIRPSTSLLCWGDQLSPAKSRWSVPPLGRENSAPDSRWSGLVIGPPGVGKTYGALAAARRAQREASSDTPEVVETVIRCLVVQLDDSDEAECSMIVGSYELPRVGFPAWVLRAVGLRPGDHFLWAVRDAENVRPADVTKVPPPSLDMTPERKAKLDQLYAEFERDRAENGDWPVTTGDGR